MSESPSSIAKPLNETSQPRRDGNPLRLRFADRVLAEAAAALARIQPDSSQNAAADQVGRETGGDLEQRIVARAMALPAAPALQSALRHVRSTIGLLVLLATVLVFVGGAAAAKAALTAPRHEPVNIFWALAALLGVQTIFLIVWIVLLVASWRGGSHAVSLGSIGGWLIRGVQFATAKIHRGPEHAAAAAAMGTVLLRSKLGKWSICALSNGLWLAFNVACLGVLIALLSARQYSFAWETTILSSRQYVPLTQAIGALPRAAGFITPTQEQITASQWTGEREPDFEASQAWSGLLVGSIVLYGFAPRLLLFSISLGQRRVASRRYRLDVTRPEFAALQPALQPASESIGVVDRDEGSGPANEAVTVRRAACSRKNLGPPAILGFELPPQGGRAIWPPPLHNVRWLDLGMVDSHADQQRIIEQLANSPTEPSRLVVACALTATPDRGVGAFLARVQHMSSQPVALLLTAGEALRRRAGFAAAQQRIDDWRNLAKSAGIAAESVLELDLEHLTQSSAANLAAFVNSDGEAHNAISGRRIEQAFDAIAKQAAAWLGAAKTPSEAERAELHRQLARLYGEGQARWRDLLATPTSLGANLAGQLKSSAGRVIQLLPARLQHSPKWIAAGAATGALGCVAAASLLSPVAIAALPMWSAIGGGISGLLSLHRSGAGSAAPADDDDEKWSSDVADAVRAAALFALLLELQGRDEKTITGVLDRTLSQDGESFNVPWKSLEQIRSWLDDLRHRLDLALVEEAAR